MPYQTLTGQEVQNESYKMGGATPPEAKKFEVGLNVLEADGWTLAHVIEGNSTNNYTLTFIFHKPIEPAPDATKRFGLLGED